MTPDQIEAERTKFEAWFASRPEFLSDILRRTADGEYFYNAPQYAWEGVLWKAEEQYASERAALELMERQEPQRLAMEAKHESGE